jgi:hypothetical protein
MRARVALGGCKGAAGVGALLLFAAALTAFMLVCEFYYAFSVRQGIDNELSRAVNTAVSLSVSDIHRQDRLSELDAQIANERFFEYLYNDMKLSRSLEAKSRNGESLYTLEIEYIDINPSPPGMRVSVAVALRPIFLSKIAPSPIRFTVRTSSVNRRID